MYCLRDLGDPSRLCQRSLTMGLCLRTSLVIYIMNYFAVTDIQFQEARRRAEVSAGGRRYHQDRIVRLSRITGQDLSRKGFPQRIRRLFRRLLVLSEGFRIDFLSCQLLFCERKHTVVFQQDHALAVRIHRLIPVLSLCCCLCRYLRISVRILEHPQFKKFCQCTCHCTVDGFIREDEFFFRKSFRHRMGVIVIILSALVCFQAFFIVKQAADQVHAAVGHCKSDSLRLVQHLNAPAHIVHDPGIGVDIALESHLSAEKTVNERLVECEPVWEHFHLSSVFICLGRALLLRRLCVIRHNGGCIAVDRRLERRKVIFLKASLGLVYVPLSHLVMGIKSVLSGSAAREVFHCHRHAVVGDSVFTSLDDRDDMLKDLADELCVLAKGTERTLPARICHRVCHIHIPFSQSGCVPAVPDALSELIRDLHVIALDRRRNTQRPRPGREYSRRVVHPVYDFAVLVSRV